MTTLTRADWEQRARDLKIEGRAYLNGEYTDAVSGETFECISPVDGRLLGKIASCDAADAQRAVENARATFNSGVWSRLAPTKRKATMIRFAGLLKQHAEELALLETLDMGKPINDSLNIDVPGAAQALSWNGEAIDKVYDEVAATPHDQLGLVTREPVGVVGAIVPWNFPLMMACWKLGPALSTGNSVILKPSEKSPLTAIRIAALAVEAGIPKGVLNVLPGYGHTVGKALALHMDVDTLVFTGSTKIAKQLMIYAGESNMKRVWLEAGGKSPNIVFADAPDLQAAAESAASAIAFNQGEVWMRSGLPVKEMLEHAYHSGAMQQFRTRLFTRIVPILKEIGLFGPKVQKALGDMGVMEYAKIDIEKLIGHDLQVADDFDKKKFVQDAIAAE